MQRAYRATIVVLFAIMALTVMGYLSNRFAKDDVEKGVAAVQAHLFADQGESALRASLGEEFGLTQPELRWWGRVTSEFYGVVQVTLVARDLDHEETFVWEIGLISGDLVPKNEAAAELLRLLGEQTADG